MPRLAALQIGSAPEGPGATLERILAWEQDLAAARPDLVVMPEALLGGYPKGESFGTYLGYRLPEGRARYADYHAAAVDLEGAEVRALCGLADRLGAHIVVGVIERAGPSLYCTALFLAPGAGLAARHRKLMPTALERLIWSSGDGSTLPVVESPAGRLGAAICWENHMPLFRTAMYAKGVDVWCAPTVDDRDIWQASMRHIAHEGRCFLVSACQVQPSPKTLGVAAPGLDHDRALIRGGSVIVGPLGDVLAGPLFDAPGVIAAEVSAEDLVRARYDFNAVGHYARNDVFTLTVDETPRLGVVFRGETG